MNKCGPATPGVHPLRETDPRTVGGYALVGRLGQGGQGVVFAATRPSGDRVAVKLLAETTDPQVRNRFLKEVAAAQRVARFCTAQVLDSGIHERRPFIVSEYVDGPSLKETVECDGPRTGGALERIAVATGTALGAIHAAGMVHRDFKPANVVLGPDGPVVIDFGLAAVPGMTTQLSNPVVAGTPAFMAPEHLRGARVTAAADMWSWAVSMVYAGTGKLPFTGESFSALAFAILHGTPTIERLPAPLDTLVRRCLNRDPGRRPTAQEAVSELVGAGAQPMGIFSAPAISASPNSDTAAPPKAAPGSHASRRPWRAVIGFGVAITAAAALTLTVFNVEAPHTPSRPPPRNKQTVTAPLPPPRQPPPGTVLPGTSTTLTLDPNGPLKLIRYIVARDGYNYVLNPATGRFSTANDAVMVSPDGWHEAIAGGEAITIVNRRTGEHRTTADFGYPAMSGDPQSFYGAFSPDGRYLTELLEDRQNDTRAVIVNIVNLKFRIFRVPAVQMVYTWWSADSASILVMVSTGLAVYDLSGHLEHVLHIGRHVDSIYTSPGRLLYSCGSVVPQYGCVADIRTGKLERRVPGLWADGGEFGILGFYDDTHIYGWLGNRLAVRDFAGRMVRVLAVSHDDPRFGGPPALEFAHVGWTRA